MDVQAISDTRGAPSGKQSLAFSEGKVLTIIDVMEEDGELYATETEYETLWFPLSSTDWSKVEITLNYNQSNLTPSCGYNRIM